MLVTVERLIRLWLASELASDHRKLSDGPPRLTYVVSLSTDEPIEVVVGH